MSSFLLASPFKRSEEPRFTGIDLQSVRPRGTTLLSSNGLMSWWWLTEIHKWVLTPIVTEPTYLALLLLTLLRFGLESTYELR